MANAGSSDDSGRQRNALEAMLIVTHHERVECVLIDCGRMIRGKVTKVV
jgi:hypothetical protein